MRRIQTLSVLLMLLAGLLCLTPGARASDTPDAVEMARQAASAAHDNAVGVEEREEALQKLNEALRLFLSVGETMEAARVLNRIGRLQIRLQHPPEARDSHLQALDLLKQTTDPNVEIDNLNGLAAAYLLMPEQRMQVVEVLQHSLSLSEQAGYLRGHAQALLLLSDWQNYDHHELALQTAQQALALWETLEDKEGLAQACSQIGEYYMAQSLLPEAVQKYQQALGLWRDLNNVPEQAEALINLGFIENRKGEWNQGISLLTQAQGMLDERAEPDKMGQVAAALAEAFNGNGLPENGLIQYQRALDYYSRAQDPQGVAYVTWGIGVTYYLQGKYPEASTYLEQVIASVGDDHVYAALGYEYLGRVHSAQAEYAPALQNLQSALAIYTRKGNPKEAAQVLGLMGQVYEQQGQLERARQYYGQALENFTGLDDHLNEAAVSYALGRLELRRGKYDAAEEYLRRSVDETEDMRRVPASTDLSAAFSATVHERYESYIECLMQKHQANSAHGETVRAFGVSELGRGRSLAELLRATRTNLISGLDPKLGEQENSLRRSLIVAEDTRIRLLGKKAHEKEELDSLDANLARMKAEYKQVNETIQARYPSYRQMTEPVAWDLQRIQEQAIGDDQTVLLEYSLGAPKSYVWAVTRHNIKSYELDSEESISAAAQKLYKLLADAPRVNNAEELALAAQELGRKVLSPVAGELNKRRIIIVADGALNYIPFQVLPVSQASREPLVADYEVINAPSASILGDLSEEASRRQPTTKLLAAFGDPVFASSYVQYKDKDGGGELANALALETAQWRHALRDIALNGDSFDPSVVESLFYAKSELDNLRGLTGDGASLVASDFAATREQLLSTDLTQYAILHFATHALLDSTRPENSGLLLSTVNRSGQARNGFVKLQDIYGLRASVNLVVLSACQTAIGKDTRGEGLLGLTRGFMYAGATSVVASLWKVDDRASAELMKQFYANMLQKGMVPAEALREAQNSIRHTPRWNSPYYWAAFTLQGDYRQAIKTPPTASVLARYGQTGAASASLTLLSWAGWWYRRRRRRRAREGA
jgi:CHAT domain-containing protein/tetratricopeptide (TPR) repeat protein